MWKFLTFTANFGMDFKHAGAFSHAWSLCVEEHFYLVLPLLVIAIARRKASNWVAPSIAAIFISGMLFRLGSWLYYLAPIQNSPHNVDWYITYFQKIYYPSYNRLDGLLAGVNRMDLSV